MNNCKLYIQLHISSEVYCNDFPTRNFDYHVYFGLIGSAVSKDSLKRSVNMA